MLCRVDTCWAQRLPVAWRAFNGYQRCCRRHTTSVCYSVMVLCSCHCLTAARVTEGYKLAAGLTI